MVKQKHLNKRLKAQKTLEKSKDFTPEQVLKAKLVLRNSDILMGVLVKGKK